jgi:hypothetical protein
MNLIKTLILKDEVDEDVGQIRLLSSQVLDKGRDFQATDA